MKEITRSDLMIIIEGAYQMAQVDSDVDNAEISLLEKMMKAGGTDSQKLADFEKSNSVDLSELSSQLSSEKAKKLFLLTLAATALADQNLDINETDMMNKYAKELNVGVVAMNRITFENCEKLILKLIVEPTQDKNRDQTFAMEDF